MSDKRGFTLIELLGVFVILSIIVLITFPYATGLLKNTKDSEYERFEENIFLATEAYIEANDELYNQFSEEGTIDYISILELINSGFLSKNITNPQTKEKIKESGSVKVSKNSDDFDYEYKENDDYSLSGYVKDDLLSMYDIYKKPILENGVNYLQNLNGIDNEKLGAKLNGFADNGWKKSYMEFDGTDDFVDLGFKSKSFSNGVTFEIIFSIYEEKNTNQEFFGNWESVGGGISYKYSTNKIAFNLKRTNGTSYDQVITTDSIFLNTWYSIVGTYDNNNLKIYLNGTLQGTTSAAGIMSSSQANIVVGGNPTLNNSITVPGAIKTKRFALYDRALTETEVKQNYEVDKIRYDL